MLKHDITKLVLAIASTALLGLGCGSADTPGNGAPTGNLPAEDKVGTPAGDDYAALDPADPAGGDGCVALASGECGATEGCQPVRGSLVVAMPGQGAGVAHCVKPRVELGCIPAQMCASAISYFCNDKGEVFEVTSACGPVGWKPCEAPAQLQGDCAE